MPVASAAALASAIDDYLAGSRTAIVLEDGAVVFDLSRSKYSLSGEHGKCIAHFWSDERNAVRRVLDCELKNGVLRLSVQRMGQARPSKLEICRERDPRTPSARKAARAAYNRQLQRMLERKFPDLRVSQMSTGMDLERSLSPVYARGLLRRGQSAWAVLGVNKEETQASIDAALTFGILWFDLCRETHAGKAVVEGLKLFVPTGRSAVIRERMAHLNRGAAKWRLVEFEEREDALTEIDTTDRGNIATRLVRCPDESVAHERFAEPIAWIREILPQTEVAVLSPGEIAFRHRGLEFARARLAADAGSFRNRAEVVFGLGAEETVLSESNAERFARQVRAVAEVRHPDGPRDHRLFRLHPERWLETLAVADVRLLDGDLDNSGRYSQVPAFSSSDRAMIDVLTCTRAGRLAVVELKAEEDIHLPLQGLDYWARVAWHHVRGEFQRFAYFPGKELSSAEPLLYLVAPALHVHPATDTILRYISPAIDWTLLGIDEHWREGVRVVFRKRPQSRLPSQSDLQRRDVFADRAS